MFSDSSNNPLTIIKASAGSGKTHRLTLEFLKLTLSYPDTFKHVLAVTFTNKATAEMKQRIIEELGKIVFKPHKAAMLEDLVNEMNCKPDEVQSKANLLLEDILHQYTHFSVSTIDHFFQGIIRSLTRELNLNGGYKIQLNQDEIIEEAVTQFLIDLKHDSDYMQVMLEFIDAQMSDEKSWNVEYQLKNFTSQLFKEQVRYVFVKYKGSLTGEIAPGEIRADLHKKINSFTSSITDWAKQVQAFLHKNQIGTDDFKGKKNNPIIACLNTIQKKKYEELPVKLERLLSVDEWGNSKSDIRDFVNSLAPHFNHFINDFEQILEGDFQQFLESEAIYKNIFQLSLAHGLMEKVSDVLTEQNLFMLSDAPVLINLFTDSADTPFIYEKTGNRFRHFMIDEFQDTSQMQWQNFKPLLEESLATGTRGNFVVGDVKQAIYRWRNGDWSLLHSKVAEQIRNVQTETLQKNWRSHINIVSFNNAFFEELRNLLFSQLEAPYNNELKEMYSDVKQTIDTRIQKKRQGGYVYCEAIEGKKVDEFKNNALLACKNQIDRLKKDFDQHDICVLVRKGDELKAVASYLINQTNYDIISTGSLALNNSRLLQFVLAVMRYLSDPQTLYLKTIAYFYNRENTDISLHYLFTTNAEAYLPRHFNKKMREMGQMPVLNLIGEIIDYFDLENQYPNQTVFLSRFYNEVKSIVFDKGSNIEAIIDWWDEKGETMNIDLPETTGNSIQIMTIHKSKGLQFEHVILPFAQWQPGNQVDILWLDGKYFNNPKLNKGLFPASLKKMHLYSDSLKMHYEKEQFAMLVDQVNMLYVANTRAIKGLFLFYQKEVKGKTDISKWILSLIAPESTNGITDLGRFSAPGVFEIGELTKAKPSKDVGNQIDAIQLTSGINTELKSNIQAISTHEPEEKELAVLYGSLLHKIFENIITQKDIDPALTLQVNAGLLTRSEAERLKIQITHWLNSKEVSEWFSGEHKVLTETEIIVPQGSTRRPDRVILHTNRTIVVDLKFSAQKRDVHKKQVQEYCRLFEAMQFAGTVGFVWYPILGEVVEVV